MWLMGGGMFSLPLESPIGEMVAVKFPLPLSSVPHPLAPRLKFLPVIAIGVDSQVGDQLVDAFNMI